MIEAGVIPTPESNGAAWRNHVVLDFAKSELFDRTFQEGMELVEETAGYLDGAGRQESRRLTRKGALAYAAESMRLTTRLMQVASWLLVQRAVREGDMAPADACDSRYRLAAEPLSAPTESDELSGMPANLRQMLIRSERLYERVMHLDRRMYVDAPGQDMPHPVLSQMEKLQAAFGR